MKNTLVLLLLSIIACPAAWSGEAPAPTRQNPFTTSSQAKGPGKLSYGPAMAFDWDWQTAWCEGAAGTGDNESFALYLGDAALMGGPQKVSVRVFRGYQKTFSSYENNSKPTKIRVELLAGERLLASRDQVLEHSLAEVELGEVPQALGDLWLRVTLLASSPGAASQTSCITEVRPRFEKANPHNSREFIRRLCLLVTKPGTPESNQELKALVKKVRRHMINEFEEPKVPRCSPDSFDIVTERDISVWGAEEGDGATVLRLHLPEGGVIWKLTRTSGFSLID